MSGGMNDSTLSLNFGNLKSSMNYSTLSLMSVNASTNPSASRQNNFNSKDFVFCLTRKSMIANNKLMIAIKHLNPEYTIAETEEDLTHMAEERRKYYFVCDAFGGDLFKLLRKKSCRICAPPFLMHMHSRNRPLPESTRPLYNGSMFGVAVCFTGFAVKREALNQLADLVHFMGGSVRKDFSGRITHVVAYIAQGQKYKAAVNLEKHIMTENWILEAWERRNEPSFKATRQEFIEQFQMKPFQGLKLSFVGFSSDEAKHMEELTVNNGGTHVPFDSEGCTHLVVEETYNQDVPQNFLKATNVVKQEWFWTSIQLDACAEESLYYFTTEEGTPLGTGSHRLKKKRKYLNASDLSDLLSPGSPFTSNKRRSKEGRLSTISAATFDSSMGSPFSMSNLESPDVRAPPEKKPLTARQQICLELQQTERNYVDVLHTIVKVFKEPLEQSSHQRGGALLAPEEIKTIFGSIPELLEVHEKLLASIDELMSSWDEEKLVGKAVVDCAAGMSKAYPAFVNYFDMIKETIVTCDKERPRFHAFLKICLTKPDCGRQTLAEMLIRPVQRIPSLSLLLNDILKKTPETNPDHNYLKEAVEAIKKVLTYINEDRRRTEHQVQMFEIIRDVDKCPPNILSSNRNLVSKAETLEVSEGLVIKSDHLIMFLFNDSIEIAKRKNRNAGVTGGIKSPAIQNIQRGTQQKSYKHVEFLKLAYLKSIVDVKSDDEEFKDLFGFIYHSPSDNKDKLNIYKFIGGSCLSKVDWMTTIVKCLSDMKCVADRENFLVTVDASELLLDKSECGEFKDRSASITKVFKKAKGGISKKVSRAFSLTKTPKQNQRNDKNPTLKRAMSSITPIADVTLNNTSRMTSPTPSEYTIMDFSVCEDK